jgi:inhibitor of KinA sporulation pathway (predicted exonuclease)
MNRYITEGKFDMAVFKANKILEQQKNVSKGAPASVKATLARVQAERVDYPNRARDIQAMNRYVSEGKFDMAVFKANKILEQQRNLR